MGSLSDREIKDALSRLPVLNLRCECADGYLYSQQTLVLDGSLLLQNGCRLDRINFDERAYL